MRVTLSFDPSIEVDDVCFRRALDQNASFIEWPSDDLVPQDIQSQYPWAKGTKIMLGVTWPAKHVAFPDFLDTGANTANWWTSEMVNFEKTVSVTFFPSPIFATKSRQSTRIFGILSSLDIKIFLAKIRWDMD